jgi:hypothetical protein
MSPECTPDDFAHENLGDAKSFPNFSLRLTSPVSAADFQNGCIGEFSVPVSGTVRTGMVTHSRSPFEVSISSVLGIGSKPEMVWANARGIVAAMENAHSIRDWPEVQFPRESMGTIGSFTGDRDLAVLVFVPASRPKPALASLIDFRPKPLSNRYSGILSGHLELILRGVMRATVDAVRPLLSISRPLSAGAALTLGAGMVAI